MRYTEQQVTNELLDQPALSGKPRKLFICCTPRSGSYLLCRYMINAGLGVPHSRFQSDQHVRNCSGSPAWARAIEVLVMERQQSEG